MAQSWVRGLLICVTVVGIVISGFLPIPGSAITDTATDQSVHTGQVHSQTGTSVKTPNRGRSLTTRSVQEHNNTRPASHESATNLTGIWQYNTSGQAKIGVGTHAIYVADGGLDAVRLSNGTQQWSTSTESDLRPQVTTDQVLGVKGADVYALDADTGAEQWRVQFQADQSPQFLALAADSVFVASDERIVAYDRATGTQRWNRTVSNLKGEEVRDVLGADTERVYLYTGGYVVALNQTNGTEAWWNFDPLSSIRPSGAVTNTTVYHGGTQGKFFALNTSTGEERWSTRRFNADVAEDPVVANDTVYTFFSNDSHAWVEALDTTTGSTKWSTVVGPSSAPAQLSHRGAYIFTADMILDRVTGEILASVPGDRSMAVPGGVVAIDDQHKRLTYIPDRSLPPINRTPPTARLTVPDRFPHPSDPLVLNASNSTGAGVLTYTWYINGTQQSCSGAVCRLDVEYPANATVIVEDETGAIDQVSTVVRASQLQLESFRNGTEYSRAAVLTSTTLRFTLNKSRIQHPTKTINWTVAGPARQHETRRVYSFPREGKVSITVRVTLADPASNTTTERVTRRTLTVRKFHHSLPHYDLRYQGHLADPPGTVSTYIFKLELAEAHDSFEPAYRKITQRVGSLPDVVVFYLESDAGIKNECGGDFAACAGSGEIHYGIDTIYPWLSARTLHHELTHLAQDRLASKHTWDWEFLIEGHATYEESPVFWLDTMPKPSLAELRDFDYSSREYDEAGLFVAAFMAEYGRQTFLELLRTARSSDLESEFKRVTGDSLQSFYERWAPNNASAGPNAIRRPSADGYLNAKPMFVYQEGQLRALYTGTGVRVEWDIDDDGTYERSGPTVTWIPDSTGTYSISLRYTNGNASLAQTQRVTVAQLPANTQPTAAVTTASNTTAGARVALNATQSTDPDGDTLEYTWRQLRGPQVSLRNQTTATPTFVAPAVQCPTQLTFEVTVTDGLASDTATVTTTVYPSLNTTGVTVCNTTGVVDTNVSVRVYANAANVSGYNATLSFDPSVLQFMRVDSRTFPNVTVRSNATTGRIVLNDASAEAHDRPILATIIFHVVAANATNTTLSFSPNATSLGTPSGGTQIEAYNSGHLRILEVKPGDVTADGTINTGDVIQIQRSIVGLSTSPDYTPVAADVTDDGTVNTGDVIQVQRFIVGLSSVLD